MNEAERLAKELEEDFHLSYPSESMWKAAEELRRLSDVNKELTAINAELVEALEVLADEANSFNVSGVYFNEKCMGHKGLDMADVALEKAKQ